MGEGIDIRGDLGSGCISINGILCRLVYSLGLWRFLLLVKLRRSLGEL